MEFFAGPARGGGRAPGPGLQQPWGQHYPPRGLHPPQAGASYGGGPGLGLHPPGGPYSSEPGWWPQQGPGPRAPETKHHGGVYSGHSGMGPQLGAPGPGLGPQHPGGPYSQGMGTGTGAPLSPQHPGGPYSQGMGMQTGAPLGPQHPGGPYIQGMGMQTGAPYNTELELSPQRVSVSRLGLPQPGGHNNIDPGVGLQMPLVHQGRIYISSPNQNQGYKSGGPGQGWECPPKSVDHSRNQSPAGTSRSRECSPAGTSHSQDCSPAGMSGKCDRSPTGMSGKRDRSPAGMSGRCDCSPAGMSGRQDRSPAGMSGRQDRSPAGMSGKRDRSPTGMSGKRDRSPTGMSGKRDRSPTGMSGKRDRSPTGMSGKRDRSPTGMSGKRDRSPAGMSGKRNRSPAGMSGRCDRSPAGMSHKQDCSSSGESRKRDSVPAGWSPHHTPTEMSRGRPPTETSPRRDTTGTSRLLIPLKASKRKQKQIKKALKRNLRRKLTLKVEPFPPHCSKKNIQQALQDLFGEFGEITSIQVNGKDKQRSAMVFYKFAKDRDSALSGTQGTSLFNKNIYVSVWPYKKIKSFTAVVNSVFFAEKGSGTLYISNLSKSVSQNDLLSCYNIFGRIFYTEVQKLPGLYNYGVVQFTDKVSANKAISELNGHFLSRSMLKEKFGDSFSSNCIFVYGLSKTNFTPVSLAHHFCQFGTLKKVLFDSSSGRALVFFKDLSSAEKALHEIREKSAGQLLMGDYANHQFLARFCPSMETHAQNRYGTKYLAKENETQILVDNNEEQQKDLLTGTGEEEEEEDMLAEASEEEEEADMLAEASEEEEEADMLAEASEKMEVLDEVWEEQEAVSPLLDWSEKIEASSDSGEEAAEPLPEADEISMPAFAEVVKKNPPSERNSTFSIPVIVHRKYN
ncbi:uncharacterized protein LOC144798241 [Lissotriton helveticus]